MADPLDDMARRFAAAFVGRVRIDEVARIEREVRDAWAGDQVYIAARAQEKKSALVGARLAIGMSPAATSRDTGIPLRTVYRLMNRRWRAV